MATRTAEAPQEICHMGADLPYVIEASPTLCDTAT